MHASDTELEFHIVDTFVIGFVDPSKCFEAPAGRNWSALERGAE